MINLNSCTRLTAASIHAAFSLFIFSVLLFILVNFWYPTPYFSASGGWQGIKIVALVDVVLGPLLTFCVFNRTKPTKELVIDLSIIFTLQISALCWGIYTVYQQHPVAAVFWEDRFYTVPFKAFNEQPYDTSQLSTFSDVNPPLVFAEKPKMLDEITRLLQGLEKERVPFEQPALYRPFKDHLNDIFQHQLDIHVIIKNSADVKQQLVKIITESNSKIDDNVYIRLDSRYRNIILVFSKTGEQLGYITTPYKDEKDI